MVYAHLEAAAEYLLADDVADAALDVRRSRHLVPLLLLRLRRSECALDARDGYRPLNAAIFSDGAGEHEVVRGACALGVELERDRLVLRVPLTATSLPPSSVAMPVSASPSCCSVIGNLTDADDVAIDVPCASDIGGAERHGSQSDNTKGERELIMDASQVDRASGR